MKLADELMIKPGRNVRLKDFDPDATPGIEKEDASALLQRNVDRLSELQHLLYAENRRALLIVLQAMDAGGKDGTIRHVMSGMNPQGCRVKSFKAPSTEELAHDFLWRVHQALPAKGEIGIFNRSHYEDVLIVRVHRQVPKRDWAQRYDQINAFERMLNGNDITILKFFLHISRDEQKKRLMDRLKDPAKNWKISPMDFDERQYWNDYREAYEDALSRCSTREAPWFVIPANKKWFRNYAVSQILVETLKAMDMRFPKPAFDLSKIKIS